MPKIIVMDGSDKAVYAGIRLYQEHNPEDVVVDYDKFSPIEDSKTPAPSSFTLIGHSGWTTFGHLGAELLGSQLVDKLDKSSSQSANLHSSLDSIYMISCHTGLVSILDEKQQSYAQTVANYLWEAGYDTTVKAPSNFKDGKLHIAFRMGVEPVGGNLVTTIHATERDKIEYDRLQKQLDVHKKEFAKVNARLFEIRSLITSDPSEELKSEKAQLTTKQTELKDIIQTTDNLKRQHIKIISSTDGENPKHYLDRNLDCHFMHPTLKLKKTVENNHKKIKLLTIKLNNLSLVMSAKNPEKSFKTLVNHLIPGSQDMTEKLSQFIERFSFAANISDVKSTEPALAIVAKLITKAQEGISELNSNNRSLDEEVRRAEQDRIETLLAKPREKLQKLVSIHANNRKFIRYLAELKTVEGDPEKLKLGLLNFVRIFLESRGLEIPKKHDLKLDLMLKTLKKDGMIIDGINLTSIPEFVTILSTRLDEFLNRIKQQGLNLSEQIEQREALLSRNKSKTVEVEPPSPSQIAVSQVELEVKVESPNSASPVSTIFNPLSGAHTPRLFQPAQVGISPAPSPVVPELKRSGPGGSSTET